MFYHSFEKIANMLESTTELVYAMGVPFVHTIHHANVISGIEVVEEGQRPNHDVCFLDDDDEDDEDVILLPLVMVFLITPDIDMMIMAAMVVAVVVVEMLVATMVVVVVPAVASDGSAQHLSGAAIAKPRRSEEERCDTTNRPPTMATATPLPSATDNNFDI
ncbi:hypothetical protein V1477_008511 [Vespula maculifrons]|uniref:Uncharacterized protein n=1 Tax=Vespula maculifrons TaxID=7453 RepID=A0ABD2CD97_VESMC